MKLRLRRQPLLAFLAGVAFVLFLFVPRLAQAQSIDITNSTSLQRLSNSGDPIGKRSLTLTPEGVNYQDCIDGQQIQFPIVLTANAVGSSVQVWASASGADCTAVTARSGTTQQCWQLNNGASIATAPTLLVNLGVREIMSGVHNPVTPVKDSSVCGTVDLTPINVYFLYFGPGTESQASTVSKNVTVNVDTVGPDPPTGLKILPGNTRLEISFDNISGEGGSVALTGVQVYCDPATTAPSTSTPTATDTGTHQVCTSLDAADFDGDPDADLDGGCTDVPNEAGSSSSSSSAGSCYSPNFSVTDGGTIQPTADFNAKYSCGSLGGGTGSGVTAESVGGQPLVNGTHYAVALAGTDAYGNVGRLSTLVCDYPEETVDFWNDYKNSGGGAGGGLCTTSGAGMPVASLSVFALVAIAAVSMMLRRRTR